MKNILRNIIIAATAMSLAACDFLNVEKIGKSDIDTYFSDINSLVPAVYGTYSLTYSFYDRFFLIYGDVAGDLVNINGTSASWSRNFNFETTAEDEATPVGYIWKQAFNIIANANQIIYHAPLLKEPNPSSTPIIDYVTAQGYFIRALMHFNLCLTYAQTYTYTADASHIGVPLILRIPSMSDEIKRVSVKEVYDQVISDLETAKSLFNGSSYSLDKSYFAGADACDALLARIYLYMHDYDKAVEYSAPLIAKYPLTANADYVKMFEGSTSFPSPECILRLNGYDSGAIIGSFYNYENVSGFPSKKLTNLFEEGDVRTALHSYIWNEGTADERRYTNVNMKYFCNELNLAAKDRHYDPFLFRSSEMVLIHAEASCANGDLNTAAGDVKKIIARAKGVDASQVSLTYSSAAELDRIISEERMKELCFEGHRLFDITRRHENLSRGETNSTVKEMNYPDYRFILAIPRVERDANSSMVQNEGY